MAPLLISFLLIFLLFLMLLFRAQGRPGPKLPLGPRPLPIIGNLHLLGQYPNRALAKLAQQYGPIMSLRLGQVPTIVVSSAEAAELFLKQYDSIFASRPLLRVWEHMFYRGKDLGFIPYGDYWRRVRKMCTLHFLSPAKVAGFEGLRRRETEAAVHRLMRAAAAREVVDVGETVGELIERIVLKMVVGKVKEEDKRYDLRKVIKEAMVLIGAFNLDDFIPYLAPLDLQGFSRKTKVVRKVADEIFENIIEDHLKEDDFRQHKDILGVLLSLMHNPTDEFLSCFGRDNIKAIMLDLFAAGIDTTSVSVTWLLSALLKHPRVMKLVQAELDAIVGKERMVLESDLSKLTFLDMVIKETLRLYPVAPLLVPHVSMEDVVVNGYMIPKESWVLVNIWAIGRDQKLWSENAEEFYPERFMDKDLDVRGQHFKLIPFGAGRRICPGIQLGLTNIKLVVAQLLHCFDWELPHGMRPEEVDMTEKFGISMSRAHKLLAIPCYRLRVTL